jgi:hypothetical protein
MIDGELKFSEASINIVNKILKIQSLSGELSFKDKMLAMIVPRQAIKQGISNINSIEYLKKDIYDDKGNILNDAE